MITPYLGDIINGYKASLKLKSHYGKIMMTLWRMANSVNNENQFHFFFRHHRNSYNGLKE